MARGRSDIAELGKQTRWSADNPPKGAGRKKPIIKEIDAMPKEARLECYKMLHTALRMPDLRAAKEYLNEKIGEKGDCPYGAVLQIAVKGLAGDKGFEYMMALMDRLFGKPIQSTEIVGDLRVEQARNLTPEEAAEVMAALEKLKGGE